MGAGNSCGCEGDGGNIMNGWIKQMIDKNSSSDTNEICNRTVRMLAKFGEFYWSQYGNQCKDNFCKLASRKWKDALIEFLEEYAFERQGKPPKFPVKAAEAIREYKNDTPGDDFESDVWKNFCEKIGSSINKKNNPLAPSFGNKKSITSLIRSLDKKNYNIIRWAEDGIKNGSVRDISNELQSVRGMGPKISSLFLRDIVAAFELNESELEPEKYLQPIDIWTRRGAEVIAKQTDRLKPPNDEECAKIIVEASYKAGVPPSLVNAGMWIFGTKFAETEEKFQEVLANSDKLHQLLANQRDACMARVNFLDGLLNECR